MPLISSLKSRRYVFAFFRREKESATRTWAGGCEAPHTRAKNNFCSHCRVSREAGTWGLKKNSKMAAVRHQGGSTVFRVFPRFVAIVCLTSKLDCPFFRCTTCFFLSLLIFSLGFLHCLCFFIFYISQEYEIRLIIC